MLPAALRLPSSIRFRKWWGESPKHAIAEIAATLLGAWGYWPPRPLWSSSNNSVVARTFAQNLYNFHTDLWHSVRRAPHSAILLCSLFLVTVWIRSKLGPANGQARFRLDKNQQTNPCMIHASYHTTLCYPVLSAARSPHRSPMFFSFLQESPQTVRHPGSCGVTPFFCLPMLSFPFSDIIHNIPISPFQPFPRVT